MNQILSWLLSESGSEGAYLNRSSLGLHPHCTALMKPACRCWTSSIFWCSMTRPQPVALFCTTNNLYSYEKPTKQPVVIPEDGASSNTTAFIAVTIHQHHKQKGKKYDCININVASPRGLGSRPSPSRSVLHPSVGVQEPTGKESQPSSKSSAGSWSFCSTLTFQSSWRLAVTSKTFPKLQGYEVIIV